MTMFFSLLSSMSAAWRMRPSASSFFFCASDDPGERRKAASPRPRSPSSSFFAAFSSSRSAAIRSTSFCAAAGSPLRAAPSARAKCVIASVNGNLLGIGSQLAPPRASRRARARSAPASPRARRARWRRAGLIPVNVRASSRSCARRRRGRAAGRHRSCSPSRAAPSSGSLLFCAASAERRLVAAESAQAPTRVKMCEGMCSACGASGAILA